MDLDQTQAIFLEDYDDETDEEVDEDKKKPASHLKVLCQKGFPETTFPLFEGDNVIGRQQDSCNIYIPIKALSKQHACIEIRGDSHLLYDKGSRNKTKRGKLFLTPDVRYEVKDGDEITLADVTCHFLHHIDEDNAKADDTGSETGSESMFQTAPNSEVGLDDEEGTEMDGRRKFIESTMLVDAGEDENSNSSNASSDLLQPTQLFGAALGQKARKGRLDEATTLKFVEDSDHSDVDDHGTANRQRPRKNIAVAETPAAARMNPAEDPSTLVFPESDEEGEETTGVQTLIFDDEKKDDSGDKELLLAAPTQAYVMESDAEDEDNDSKADLSRLLTAPTQMYGMAVDDSHSAETSMDGPTLAYDVTIDDMVDDDGDNQVSNMAATQVYGMGSTDDDVEPSMACDVGLGKNRNRKSGRNCEERPAIDQAVGFDTDVNGNSGSARGSGETENSGADNPTQTFHLSDLPGLKEPKEVGGTSESSTQVIDMGDEEIEAESADFFSAPTLACDLDDGALMRGVKHKCIDSEQTGDEPSHEDDATQVFETVDVGKIDKMSNRGQRDAPEDDSTQSMGYDSEMATVRKAKTTRGRKSALKASKPKAVKADAETVVYDTVAISDEDTGQQGSRSSQGRSKQQEENETMVLNDGATVALSPEISPSKGKRRPRKSKGCATSPEEAETQIFAEDEETGEEDVAGIEAQTQMINAGASVALTEDEEDDITQEDIDSLEAETQMIATAPTLAVMEDDEEEDGDVRETCLEEATLVYGLTDEAVPAPLITSPRQRASRRSKAAMGEPTHAYGEGDDLLDIAAAHGDGVKSPKGRCSGRGRKQQVPVVEDDLPATQAYSMGAAEPELMPPAETQKARRGRKSKKTEEEFEATQAYGLEAEPECTSHIKLPQSKRGRKSKKVEEEFEVTQAYGKPDHTSPIKSPESKRGRKSKKPDEEFEATQAYGKLEHTSPFKSPQSKRGKTADEEFEATQAYGIDAEPRPSKSRQSLRKVDESEMEATQAYGDESVEPQQTSPVTKSRRGRKSKMAEEEMEATEAYGLEVESEPPKSRRRKVDESEMEATQAYGEDSEPVLNKPKDLPTSKSRRSLRKVETEMEATQAYGEDEHEYITPRGQTPSSPPVHRRKSGRKSLLKTKPVDKEPVSVDSDDSPLSPCEEVVPNSAESGEGTPTAIPLPRHSPHKSALTSPDKKKQISPKRVVFTGVGDSLEKEAESAEKEETEAKGKNSTVPNVTDMGMVENVESSPDEQGSEEIENTSTEQSISMTRKGKRGRGVQSISPVVVEHNEPNPVVSTRRGRVVKPAPSEAEPPDVADEPTPTASSKRGRGRKSLSNAAKKPETDVVSEEPIPAARRGRGAKSVTGEAEKPDFDVVTKEPSTVAKRGRGRKSVASKVKDEPSSDGTSVTGEAEKPEFDVVTKEPSTVAKRGRGRKSVASKVKDEPSSDGTSTANADNATISKMSTTKGRGTRTRHTSVETIDSTVAEADLKNTEPSTRKGRGIQSNVTSETYVEDTSEQNVEKVAPINKKGHGSKSKSTVEEAVTEAVPAPAATNTRGRGARSKDRNNKVENTTQSSAQVTAHSTRKGRNSKMADTSLVDEASGEASGTRTGRITTSQEAGSSTGNTGRLPRGRQSTSVLHLGEAASDTQSISSVDSETSTNDTGKRRGRGRPMSMAVTKEKKSDMGPPHLAVNKGRGRKPVATAYQPDEDSGSVKTLKKQKLETTQQPAASPTATRTPAKRRSEVVEPPPSSPILRRKSMEAKPHIMFTGVVDEQGQKIMKEMGGSLAGSVYDCTHLVTDKVRRTVKFLCCLARGLPVVVPQWLEGCRDAGTFIDPSPFLVKDGVSEKQHKFTLQRSLEKASTISLLSGYRIHVTKSVRPDPTQMKDIVQCAGAEFLSTLPRKYEEDTVVITCEEDKTVCQPAITAGIPCVSSEFILTGILQQEIMLDNYRLFIEGKAAKRGGTELVITTATKKRRR